jgi:hypothetical protein
VQTRKSSLNNVVQRISVETFNDHHFCLWLLWDTFFVGIAVDGSCKRTAWGCRSPNKSRAAPPHFGGFSAPFLFEDVGVCFLGTVVII